MANMITSFITYQLILAKKKNNLADSNPELLKRLDDLIEDYLTETNAVTPVPNPDFDPKQFDPSAIGKPLASMKKNKKSKKPTVKKNTESKQTAVET